MSEHRVLVEFVGGPYDGRTDDQVTGAPIVMPERIPVGRVGEYRRGRRREDHYVYSWLEGRRASER